MFTRVAGETAAAEKVAMEAAEAKAGAVAVEAVGLEEERAALAAVEGVEA